MSVNQQMSKIKRFDSTNFTCMCTKCDGVDFFLKEMTAVAIELNLIDTIWIKKKNERRNRTKTTLRSQSNWKRNRMQREEYSHTIKVYHITHTRTKCVFNSSQTIFVFRINGTHMSMNISHWYHLLGCVMRLSSSLSLLELISSLIYQMRTSFPCTYVCFLCVSRFVRQVKNRCAHNFVEKFKKYTFTVYVLRS